MTRVDAFALGFMVGILTSLRRTQSSRARRADHDRRVVFGGVADWVVGRWARSV
jgi:hypothetical protein